MPYTGPIFFKLVDKSVAFAPTYVITDFQGVSQAISAYEEATALNLSKMNLWSTGVRYKGALFALLSGGSVISLDLSANNLGLAPDSIGILLEGLDTSKIQVLKLAHNLLSKLKKVQLRQLSEQILGSGITELDLSHNGLGDLLVTSDFLASKKKCI